MQRSIEFAPESLAFPRKAKVVIITALVNAQALGGAFPAIAGRLVGEFRNLEFDVSTTWASTLKWTRTVHIYLTLAAMLLLLFFATTGFLMNHAEWFKAGEAKKVIEEVKIPVEELKDQFSIVEFLRANFRCEGEAKFVEPRGGADPGASAKRKTVQFRMPGKSTDVQITLETGDAKITRQDQGVYGVLADMHKGKQSTSAWKLLTDLTAISLVGAVITGFIMWLGLKKRRTLGIIGLVGSVAVAGTLFFLATR